MRRLVFLLAFLCAALVSAQAPMATLRPGDEIGVVVLGYEKYSGDYKVAEDGTLSGVGFGPIDAAGKTLEQIKAQILAELKKRFREPSVDVILRKQADQFVYVVGGVNSEPILFTRTLDLRQVVGVAGLSDVPELMDCRVSRSGEPVRVVNLSRLLKGESDEWNGPLSPNDVVTFLTKSFRVTVSGEVKEPGQYVVRSDSQIAAVIATAKGITKEGTLNNVLVFRGPDVFQVDLAPSHAGHKVGFLLEPGDSVLVRKSEKVVYALGEVRMPGRYVVPDNQEFSAADLLAMAQGLNEKGSLRRVTLVRPGENGKFASSSFNLDEFLKEGKKASNPTLRPGDILMFGQPKSMPLLSLNQIASTAFLLNGIFKP